MRRLLAPLIAVLVLLALAPAAQAYVTLTPGDRTSGGGREALVEWGITCAGEPPERVALGLYLRDRDRKAELFQDLKSGGAQGSKKIVLPAGGEFVARAYFDCGGGEAYDESGPERTAPWLNEVVTTNGELCGRYRDTSKLLQVRRKGLVTITATFFPGLYMQNPRSNGELRLRFQGGGLPRSVKPLGDGWRRNENLSAYVRPKRAGRVKMWLEVAGVPTTNKLSLRVVPMPRGGCT